MGRRDADDEAEWHTAVVELLASAKLLPPDELAVAVNAITQRIGVDLTVYLIDHEQESLRALPEPGKPIPPPVPVEGTPAGRAFTALRTIPAPESNDAYRFWVPMVDGSERLGVVEVVAHHPRGDRDSLHRRSETLTGLLGHLITVKLPYGDALHRVRRTQPMTAASELLLQMLPPLTFTSRRLVVSAILEPCYDVGGDAYDYAVDGGVARFMVLDAMGRGLTAGLTSAAALSAIRAARRDGQSLDTMVRAADAALTDQFPDLRFVTGLLGELDLDTGVLRYVNAGHPPPLLLRDGNVVRTLGGGRRMPLGVADRGTEMGTEILAPDDRLLLYTDGVTEAHDLAGDRFGLDRLVDVAERSMCADLPAPETLRRLARTVLEHQGGRPSDDATLLLVEWSDRAALSGLGAQ